MRPKALFAVLAVAQSKPQRLKVQCPGSEKSRTLWRDLDSLISGGEVKCGQKVIVMGSPAWRGNSLFIPVITADKRTGYLLSDALDKKKGPSWREVLADSIKQGTDAYARTADPHIAWCDNHGGFSERTTETETVRVSDSNTGGQIGTGAIQHTYIVCKDGTRIKEL